MPAAGASALLKSILFIGLILPASAYAAAPLFTDDAGVLPAHQCQVEIWHDHTPMPTNWFLPACNLGEDLELTLGGLSTRQDPDRWQGHAQLQVKRNLIDADQHGWALAFSAGGLFQEHSSENPRLLDSLYAYVPLSIDLTDSLRMDLNAGWNYAATDQFHEFTWGRAVGQPGPDSGVRQTLVW